MSPTFPRETEKAAMLMHTQYTHTVANAIVTTAANCCSVQSGGRRNKQKCQFCVQYSENFDIIMLDSDL